MATRAAAWLVASAIIYAGTPIVHAAGTVGTGNPASCTEAALDTALNGGGNVNFNCGASPVTIALTNGKIITASTTIDGGDLIALDGGGAISHFFVNNGIAFTVSHITLQNGYGGSGSSGAIAGGGTTAQIQAIGSHFLNNISNTTAVGGAIGSAGPLTVTDSVFVGNASGCGGAIWASLSLQVTGSSFVGNQALASGSVCVPQGGGAIFVEASLGGAGAFVTNSSFSDNRANGVGGAIGLGGGPGFVTVTNATFVSTMHSTAGSAVGVSIGTINLANTVMVNTVANGTNCGFDAGGGSINDLGGNIQFNPTGPDTSCGAGVLQADPMLGQLADNGGPTPTFALSAVSPAVDLVVGDCPATDQRGVLRPQGVRCDAGAYELNGGGGPSTGSAVPVPALERSMLLLLSGLFGVLAWFFRQRLA